MLCVCSEFVVTAWGILFVSPKMLGNHFYNWDIRENNASLIKFSYRRNIMRYDADMRKCYQSGMILDLDNENHTEWRGWCQYLHFVQYPMRVYFYISSYLTLYMF